MTLEKLKESNVVVDRLFSETPDFWKKVRNYSLLAFGVATAASTTLATLGIAIPIWLTIILSVAGTLSGAAQMTKK